MVCKKHSAFRDSAASNICFKVAIQNVVVYHPDFENTLKPSCGNWWIAKCMLNKTLRCVPSAHSGTECFVSKASKCLEVCQGRGGLGFTAGSDGKAQPRFGWPKPLACNKKGPDVGVLGHYDRANMFKTFHKGHPSAYVARKQRMQRRRVCYKGCVAANGGPIDPRNFLQQGKASGLTMQSSDWCAQQLQGF